MLEATPSTWRAAPSVSDRPLPSFYLHHGKGCSFAGVRKEMRARLVGRFQEEVVPVAFSQCAYYVLP